ncbi:hypothetical protein RPPS3_34760 [Rhodopseudomonas palustris]|uniref:helix-turn-helix domain-containing protein n=1 Tax=Rhodopseudomonas palustris TaxID=1076 RepID=UPI000D1BC1DA|nr:helix-turn-helix domain-containing protein [Rhodopseudomonas palustris]AVT77538.1 hypothetical protein RPPS3_34760 [Rhodopseudomonas palustris]
MKRPFTKFGSLVADLRQRVGIATRSDLAKLLKIPLRSIDRWEAGQSRPRDKQIPLIAAVLKTDAEALLAAAGYTARTVVASFDHPFPIDALSPDSFERFCKYFLQARYPTARVERAGGQGHTQDGVDITVHLADGNSHSFQCKRVINFGPGKVRTAVNAHTVAASKKVLLLTKVASPKERAELQTEPDWEIWDREDISHMIRQLPKEEQIRLVDIFFRGQRFALLGEDQASPWETTAEFFSPFESPEGLFNHEWVLVGRQHDLTHMRSALDDDSVAVVILSGTGGSGKSKLLKQAVQEYEAAHPETVVRHLSRNASLSKKSLEDLGDRPKLLVVDDAHDQDDLGLLFQYAAAPSNEARLLLALRPYGLTYLESQASTFSLVGDKVRRVNLAPLSLEETEELAKQVLAKYSGPEGLAKSIAAVTRDCPLATVVGAQIVAKQKLNFDFAQHEDSFRKLLFGRFRDVIAGEIGTKSDAANIKAILRVLALVQPFHPEDTSLHQLIEQMEQIKVHEAMRLIRMLTEAGVIFKRGARYRLSPDVLADYLIEEHCVGPEGGSTGYAEQVFDVADPRKYGEHLLVNLGKLDWRRANGDTSNSRLIDGVWRRLKPQHEHGDPHINAVKAVAYYQPAKALDFVEDLIRRGLYLGQLAGVLRLAGYNLQYLDRVCEDLWELGKDDKRELHSAPDHPIRILAEMCEVRPNKPFEYNEEIVEFAIGLMKTPDSWARVYSPIDILRTIFKTEGHTTEFKQSAMSFGPFYVSSAFVKPLREKAFDALVELLTGKDVRVGVLAANSLADAFRYPMGLFGATVPEKTRESWTGIFLDHMKRLEGVLQAGAVDPLVALAVWRSVSWHANYGRGKTAEVARRIKKSLPNTLEFRTIAVLIGGYDADLGRFDPNDYEKKWAAHLERLASDLFAAHPVTEELHAYIAQLLERIRVSMDKPGAPHAVYGTLIAASTDFARATIHDAIRHEASETRGFVSTALSTIWNTDPDETRTLIAQLVAAGQPPLLAEVAHALARILRTEQWGEKELDVLRLLLVHESAQVVGGAIAAVRSVAKARPDLALEFTRLAKIGDSKGLASELFTIFAWEQLLGFGVLKIEDVLMLFEKIMPLPNLEDHWIETFLAHASQVFPRETAQFLMKRVEAAGMEDWSFRPVNHGPYGSVPLKFRQSDVCGELLVMLANWMKEAKDRPFSFQYRSRELFEAMFGPYEGETVDFLDNWVKAGDATDIALIAGILAEADPDFVFRQVGFVGRLLERAKMISSDAQKGAISALYRSAISGLRSGVAGQPMPRDLETKKKCEEILATLPRFSPSFELYDALLKDATRDIERSLKQAEEWEE